MSSHNLPKACLTPNIKIDTALYTAPKLHKILKSIGVSGVIQIYIPKGRASACASVTFDTSTNRDEFLNKFQGTGIQLTPLPTDKVAVAKWFTVREREAYQIEKSRK